MTTVPIFQMGKLSHPVVKEHGEVTQLVKWQCWDLKPSLLT